MAVYLAALGAGLGDLAVLLPVFQSLIEDGERVVGVARSRMQEELIGLLPGIAAVLKETEFAQQRLDKNDRYIDFAAHPIIRMADDEWLRFRTIYPSTQINEFIEAICSECQIACSLRSLRPLPFQFEERARRKVLFIPGTTGDSKTWPLEYWLELAQLIKGENIIVIGKEDAIAVQQLIGAGLKWLSTPTIADALNAVSSAQAIVAVDTGLMHISVQQGRPTVSFCNHASFWRRSYGNLVQLVTRPCDPKCVEYGLQVDAERTRRPPKFYESNVWSEDDFNFCRVPEDERCISSIKPRDVIDALEKRNLLVTA